MRYTIKKIAEQYPDLLPDFCEIIKQKANIVMLSTSQHYYIYVLDDTPKLLWLGNIRRISKLFNDYTKTL